MTKLRYHMIRILVCATALLIGVAIGLLLCMAMGYYLDVVPGTNMDGYKVINIVKVYGSIL